MTLVTAFRSRTGLRSITLCFTLALGACSHQPIITPAGPSAQSWKPLYRHDAQGASVAGDKQALINAIRHGCQIRLGWGVKTDKIEGATSVEHIADPVFVTVLSEQEVSAQISEHWLQEHYWFADKQRFSNPAHVWRGIFTTTGRFHAMVVDRASGELVKDWPQTVGMTWFGDTPCSDQGPASALY